MAKVTNERTFPTTATFNDIVWSGGIGCRQSFAENQNEEFAFNKLLLSNIAPFGLSGRFYAIVKSKSCDEQGIDAHTIRSAYEQEDGIWTVSHSGH